LSLQLPFAVVPLVKFTSSRVKMGPFASRWWVMVLAWLAAVIIIALNVKLVAAQVIDWAAGAGGLAWLVWATAVPVMAVLVALLAWMTFRREKVQKIAMAVSADQVARDAVGEQKHFRRIGVALEAKLTDSAMLAEAVAMARVHQAELVLMHVVEGVGGQWYGPQTGDSESREDEQYITRLADRLRDDLAAAGVAVRAVLGYGDVPSQLVKLARQEQVDLMVLGGHGHGRVSDVIRGETISSVRHGLSVPTLSVRG
jgi:manganese transport protein